MDPGAGARLDLLHDIASAVLATSKFVGVVFGMSEIGFAAQNVTTEHARVD